MKQIAVNIQDNEYMLFGEEGIFLGKRSKKKLGKANEDAWDAVRKITKAARKKSKQEELSRLLWREIRRQLRDSGNVVDTTAVPVTWTNESPQMIMMRGVLEKAGFERDEHLYVWVN